MRCRNIPECCSGATPRQSWILFAGTCERIADTALEVVIEPSIWVIPFGLPAAFVTDRQCEVELDAITATGVVNRREMALVAE
jgi:hypothetical protein